ncbi:hypothetical protein [Breoghania sp.]|uniref:hypothetical protein n=1 Tax=Breoghania sp. TaxID=2065378 RepID=UPI002633C7B3|nr:hypothetical protein [Breoghania sp.]MDJ0932309.1 hypothetical protein [Breoghania sp.]
MAPYSWGVQYFDDSMDDSVANSNGVIFWSSDSMDNFKVRGPAYKRVRDWIQSLKDKKAKLITIDPFHTETARFTMSGSPRGRAPTRR